MMIINGATIIGGIVFTPSGSSPPVSSNLEFTYSTTMSGTLDVTIWFGAPASITVNWGDGNSEPFTVATDWDFISHTYATDGIYTVSVSGSAYGWQFDSTYEAGFVSLDSWGDLGLQNVNGALAGITTSFTVPSSLPTSISNLNALFDNTSSFNDSNVTSWNTINVTDMSGIFNSAAAFNQNIGSWNTSNVTNMQAMFSGATNFNQDIGAWDTTNVTNMAYMFNAASSFNQDLSGWCVTNIPIEPDNFAFGSALTSGNKPVWGTCP